VGRPGSGEDVRGAILAAALHQLEATGSPDRVTVAAILNEAGCTPPSLYHYWPSRELLLQEASEQAWARFRASQSGSVSDHQDPVQRLRLRGRAYLDFSLASPALFRVLFLEPQAVPPGSTTTEAPRQTPLPPTWTPPDPPTRPSGETGNALEGLVNDVTAAMSVGQIKTGDPLATALVLWAAMHGVAALWAVTPSLPTDLARAVGDLTQDAVLAGLAGSAHDPARGT
jgi:AcrR family transcriptional regulator